MTYQYFARLLRLSQWSKGILVFLGVMYTANFHYLLPSLLATLAFCLVSSGVYLYSDLNKTSAQDSTNASKILLLLILIISLVIGLTIGYYLSFALVVLLTIYLLINLYGKTCLRKSIIINILRDASGFYLRVFAGTLGIGLKVPIWLMIAWLLVSVLIALCNQRISLQPLIKPSKPMKYDSTILEVFRVGTAIAALLSYIFYVIFAQSQSFYFLLTLPFVAIGLWRFIWLNKNCLNLNSHSINLFLQDNLSLVNLSCFILFTFMGLIK